MNPLDPTSMPVFGAYVLVASLFLLVPISRRQRLHVGHGMAVLMLFITFSRIFFFDHDFEVLGEGSFYIGHMMRAEIPGLAALDRIGINPPAMFLLFHFGSHVVGLDPVVNLKAFRLLLGALDVLLLYLIARRLFSERQVAFAVVMLFAFSEAQLTYLESDQFKNLLGHTFFLAFVLVAIDWLDAIGSRRPGQGRRLIGILALSLGMILSHQVYAHVLAGIVGLAAVSFGMGLAAERLLGRQPGTWMVVTLLAIAWAGYAFWVREFLPNLGAEGLVLMTEREYGFLTLLDEVRRPGIFVYNVLIVLAAVGAVLCARREGERRSRTFLLTLFGFFTVLSKQYVFGLYFQPARFVLIDAPFLCLFAVYALREWGARVSGLGARLFWVGVGLLMLANLALMEFGSARLDITSKALRVPLGRAEEYLFGGAAPDGQLWILLLLSAVLVTAVSRAVREPGQRGRGARSTEGGGRLFFVVALAGVTLGFAWLVEPVLVGGVLLQFLALLFPMWAMGWMPWRAIEPAGVEDRGVMRLAMVSVTSLLAFVVLWYVVLTEGGWAFDDAVRWSTLFTFLTPMVSLVMLAGVVRPGSRWRG